MQVAQPVRQSRTLSTAHAASRLNRSIVETERVRALYIGVAWWRRRVHLRAVSSLCLAVEVCARPFLDPPIALRSNTLSVKVYSFTSDAAPQCNATHVATRVSGVKAAMRGAARHRTGPRLTSPRRNAPDV